MPEEAVVRTTVVGKAEERPGHLIVCFALTDEQYESLSATVNRYERDPTPWDSSTLASFFAPGGMLNEPTAYLVAREDLLAEAKAARDAGGYLIIDGVVAAVSRP